MPKIFPIYPSNLGGLNDLKNFSSKHFIFILIHGTKELKWFSLGWCLFKNLEKLGNFVSYGTYLQDLGKKDDCLQLIPSLTQVKEKK